MAAWFLVNNLQPFYPPYLSFLVVLFFGVGVFFSLFARPVLVRLKAILIRTANFKYFTLIALMAIAVIGIISRFYFYFHFSYTPISDPFVFVDAAQKIANGQGIVGDFNAGFFPYLVAYENILGLILKIITDPWLAIILLNTAFDIGGATIMYLLVKRLTKEGSRLPLLSFAVWLLSPFNILFSVTALPLIIVNFFIILSILLIYLLIDRATKLKSASALAIATLLGVIMGYGNCFRPVFSIALIALFLIFIYTLFVHNKSKKLLRLLAISFLVVAMVFIGIQKLNTVLISNQTGITSPSNPSGWSIFVGSNIDTAGNWNLADNNKIGLICKDDLPDRNYVDCHKELQKAGIERYRSYGVNETLSLIIRKLYSFSSNQNIVFNADKSIDGYVDSKTGKVINLCAILFIFVLFSLNIRFLYQSAKNALVKKDSLPIIVFSSLLILGFFFSIVFVESAARYAQVMYPIFTLFAVLSLESLISGTRRY